jgi:hypothetical protein
LDVGPPTSKTRRTIDLVSGHLVHAFEQATVEIREGSVEVGLTWYLGIDAIAIVLATGLGAC